MEFLLARGTVRVSPERLADAVEDRWSLEELRDAIGLLTRADGSFASGVRVVAPELVRAVQRERLLEATIVAAATIGYPALRVADVLKRAGVSRAIFYEHFDAKEDCFLATFEVAAARLFERVRAAAGGGGDWRDGIRRGLEALLRHAEEQPDEVRLVVVTARGSTPAGVLLREQLMERFASCLDEMARPELLEAPSPIAAPGVIGGVESVLYSRLQKGAGDASLEQLLPSLMYFAVLAYLGPEAAETELRAAEDRLGASAASSPSPA
jgi:AcrR family transcriptional regulator